MTLSPALPLLFVAAPTAASLGVDCPLSLSGSVGFVLDVSASILVLVYLC